MASTPQRTRQLPWVWCNGVSGGYDGKKHRGMEWDGMQSLCSYSGKDLSLFSNGYLFQDTEDCVDLAAVKAVRHYLPELTRLSIVWYPLRGSVLLLKTSTDPTDCIIGGIGPSPNKSSKGIRMNR